MHGLVRKYLKTAIGFLAIGLALGGWMMVQREFSAAYWFVTVGTATRIAGELLRTVDDSGILRTVVVMGGFSQIAGIGAFFFTMWARIRPAGSQAREAKGERF